MKKKYIIIFVALILALVILINTIFYRVGREESKVNFEEYNNKINEVLTEYGYSLSEPEIYDLEEYLDYRYEIFINDDIQLYLTFTNLRNREYVYISYYTDVSLYEDRRDIQLSSLLVELYNSCSRKQISPDIIDDLLFNDRYIMPSDFDYPYNVNSECREINLDYWVKINQRWRLSYNIYPKFDNNDEIEYYTEKIFLAGQI